MFSNAWCCIQERAKQRARFSDKNWSYASECRHLARKHEMDEPSHLARMWDNVLRIQDDFRKLDAVTIPDPVRFTPRLPVSFSWVMPVFSTLDDNTKSLKAIFKKQYRENIAFTRLNSFDRFVPLPFSLRNAVTSLHRVMDHLSSLKEIVVDKSVLWWHIRLLENILTKPDSPLMCRNDAVEYMREAVVINFPFCKTYHVKGHW